MSGGIIRFGSWIYPVGDIDSVIILLMKYNKVLCQEMVAGYNKCSTDVSILRVKC